LNMLICHGFLDGKYNNNGQDMIQRVYTSNNMDSSFVVQDCNQLNRSNITANIHMPSTPMLPLVSTNFLQDSIDKHRVHSNQEPTCLLQFLCLMTHQKIGNMVTSLPMVISVPFGFAIPFSFVLCRISLAHNRRRGRLFVKKGRMMRT